ncbi:head-tail connector protein [Sphingobium sp.]|uniref:head-tail connector protein n=1 Tax=Sphingobium sp. TaxID=1912891 RepID=UPI003BB55BB7
MPDIVALDETKLFLRVDHDEEDTIIATMIAAATDAVRDVAESWIGTGDAPARLKMAVLTRVAIMFDDRASVAPSAGEDRLLLPLRTLEL